MIEEPRPAFDSVSISDEGVLARDRGRRVLQDPALRRICHVLERTVRFSLRGVEVDRKDVLASLRRTRASGA